MSALLPTILALFVYLIVLVISLTKDNKVNIVRMSNLLPPS